MDKYISHVVHGYGILLRENIGAAVKSKRGNVEHTV